MTDKYTVFYEKTELYSFEWVDCKLETDWDSAVSKMDEFTVMGLRAYVIDSRKVNTDSIATVLVNRIYSENP